jgi:hypothetical protein
MAYTAFDPSKPNPGTQAGTAEEDSVRYNLQAMRDMIAAIGMCPGFDMSLDVGTGNYEEPQYVYYKRTPEWIRVTQVWTSHQLISSAFHYSSNSGNAWDAIVDLAGKFKLTYTYDGSTGAITATTWST